MFFGDAIVFFVKCIILPLILAARKREIMRSKKAVINTIINLLEEFVAVICGFILPRLILTAFGSKYNGLMTSITQFLSCAVLLRFGIGGVTRAALYKPLAQNNKAQIDAIMKATDLFMRKIGLILGFGIIVFAAIYPLFVSDEFEWLFTFSLFVIIAKILESGKVNYGFDAYNETYTDMIDAGIVDPTKVTRSALENAASVAAMVLTTESLVADKPEDAAAANAAAAAAAAQGGMY